jgi:hypothetical protein
LNLCFPTVPDPACAIRSDWSYLLTVSHYSHRAQLPGCQISNNNLNSVLLSDAVCLRFELKRFSYPESQVQICDRCNVTACSGALVVIYSFWRSGVCSGGSEGRTPATPWHAAAVADNRACSNANGCAWRPNHTRGCGILECFHVHVVTAETILIQQHSRSTSNCQSHSSRYLGKAVREAAATPLEILREIEMSSEALFRARDAC